MSKDPYDFNSRPGYVIEVLSIIAVSSKRLNALFENMTGKKGSRLYYYFVEAEFENPELERSLHCFLFPESDEKKRKSLAKKAMETSMTRNLFLSRHPN